MIMSMKLNHSNYLATVCKHVKAPPQEMLQFIILPPSGAYVGVNMHVLTCVNKNASMSFSKGGTGIFLL